jgi:uncharacterized protein YrrD
MTTFHEALGRPVIATATAEQIGEIKGFVLDEHVSVIRAIHTGGTKRSPEFVSWGDIDSFGPDAVMIVESDRVRSPHDEREERTASGELTVLDKRVLTDLGDELATVDDVDFDPVDGHIEAFIAGTNRIPSERYLGIGSFAVVVTTDEDTTTDTT